MTLAQMSEVGSHGADQQVQVVRVADDRDRIVTGYLAGEDIPDLSAATGWSKTSVWLLLVAEGVQRRPRGSRNKTVDAGTLAEFKHRYVELGQSSYRIGRDTGFAPNTVLTYLRAAGVRIRDRSERPGSGS